MATNPYFSQYHTQRFSLIGSPQQRDGSYSKDQRFLNMYPELIKSNISDGKKYYLKKRPGLFNIYTNPSGPGQGIFFWRNTYFYSINGTLYRQGVALFTHSSTTPFVGFAEFRSSSGINQLFFCDGTSGWMINSVGGFALITDPNFPTPHIPAPVFLDGYMFLAVTDTQSIHNSQLDDPTTWPTDGFIDAEMYPDTIQTLTKAQNYLVAVGTESCEFFYDNANSTGSPLQRNAPAVAQFGTPAPMTVNQTEKEVILVGTTNNGGRTCWVIDGFQPTEIANEPVREALDAEGGFMSNARAFTIQTAGHKFYVLNLKGNNRTFVYDFEEKMWHEWTSGTGQACFNWDFACDPGNGYPALLSSGTGQVAGLDPNTYQDTGNDIFCQATTVKVDFDTDKRKRFYRCTLVGDGPNGNSNVPITIGWSDDDYNTWTTKTMQMNGTYPTITQLGYSRRRAFQFTYVNNLPLRLESFELDIIQEVRR